MRIGSWAGIATMRWTRLLYPWIRTRCAAEHSSFVPEQPHAPQQGCPLTGTGKECRSLFEHGIGTLQECVRDREANGLRSLEIDDKLKSRGLLYRYVFWLSALQNPLHKFGAVPN
jgi:hypothetical protein